MPSDTYTLTISDSGVAAVADGAVTTAKIANYTVEGTGVTTAKIESYTVAGTGITTAKIADNAVITTKILNLNVTTPKIADSAITTVKLEDSSSTTTGVTAAKIATNAVTTDKILDSNVTAPKLGADAVITTKISNNNVTVAKLQQIGTYSVLGNNTASTGNVAAITSSSFSLGLLASADQAAARSALGIGTLASQNVNAVAITGGNISNVTFTGVSVSGASVDVSGPTGVLPVSNGGTALYSYNGGDIIYASGTTSLARLTKNADPTTVLHASGSGSNAPTWGKVSVANDVTGILAVANGGTGSATGVTTGLVGYATGASAGATVQQPASRTTNTPSINKATGAIILYTAAPAVGTYFSFNVLNNTISVTDTVVLSVRNAANTYVASVSNITEVNSFQISMVSILGTATDTPIVNFAIIKASST